MFRDWLRAHPEDRDRYSEVKRKLAARGFIDQMLYNNDKRGSATTCTKKSSWPTLTMSKTHTWGHRPHAAPCRDALRPVHGPLTIVVVSHPLRGRPRAGERRGHRIPLVRHGGRRIPNGGAEE